MIELNHTGEGRGQKAGFEQVHGRNEYQFPQLEMVRPDLDGVPELELPPGYEVRDFRPGDEWAWGEIMSEAFTPYWDANRFLKLIAPHYSFNPHRVIFMSHNSRPVGSASAFLWPGVPRERGYMHMLGVKKAHCGKGLGYWLAVACLHRFKTEGMRSAMLQTEDFRIPAIKHYLRLGFRPVLVREEQRKKWRELISRAGCQDLISPLYIEELKVMNRVRFWWRTALVVNYMSWLNLKWDMGFRPQKSPNA